MQLIFALLEFALSEDWVKEFFISSIHASVSFKVVCKVPSDTILCDLHMFKLLAVGTRETEKKITVAIAYTAIP